MKLKLIFLLVALIAFGQSASPNRYCGGIKTVTVIVADDESDLIPTKYFFNHI